MRHPKGKTAFTLLELAIAILVIAIIALLALPVISGTRARAQRVQCTNHLRSLATAANLYIQQHGGWPQIRLVSDDGQSISPSVAAAWIDVLKPFGVTEKTWICPTVQAALGNPDYLSTEDVRIDYLPLPYDDKPTTAHEWLRSPWFVEAADVHGNGNLVVFGDGSVTDLKSLARASPPPN